MQLIAAKEIIIAKDRQRQEFEPQALAELTDSIAKVGLLQAVVLRADRVTLVSGERRLRAIANLPLTGDTLRHDGGVIPEGMIPYVTLDQLDELSREEAEYDENCKRADYTWQERAAATSKLESIRRRQAAERGAPPPTVADVAAERTGSPEGKVAGGNFERTRRELIVSQHLGDPEVAGAKTVDEAWKVLKRKDEAQRNIRLGASVGLTFTADVHEAHNPPDSVTWMAGLPAESIDVVLSDIPYGMGADEFGNSGGRAVGAHGYADDYGTWKVLVRGLAPETFRVAKPQAHLYLFCDIDRFHELRSTLTDAGWTCFRTPLIWHKPAAMRAPWPENGPQRKYELILYAMKGKRPVTRLYPDVVEYPPDENLGHQAQKPVALFADLLRRSIRPGDTVLDMCMGSGPIFPAAHELKCRAIGADKDPASYGIAVKRLEQLKAQKELGL